MKLIGIVVLMCAILVADAALAQGPQQPPPPANVRALSNKLLTEIDSGMQCNTNLIGASDKIAALEAEVKDLKAKLAKPDESPKP
jgi:hypothetical protein